MKCKLCSSTEVTLQKSIDTERLISQWRDFLGIDIRSEYQDLRAIDLWRCSNCSLYFFAPDSAAGSSQLYSQLEKFDWYYREEKWEYDQAVRDLKGCKNALEIGCGSGKFMLMAQQQAGIHIEGLEQNQRAIDEACSRGLKVKRALAEEAAAQSPGGFDAICSFQVLEHVPVASDFLSACCALLRTGGKLIIAVPNADSYIRHESRNLLDMPPHHMSRWPLDTLAHLGRFYPLRLLRLAVEPLPSYHVPHFIDVYKERFSQSWFRPLDHPRVRSWLARALRLGLAACFTGQNVYACYERVEDRDQRERALN